MEKYIQKIREQQAMFDMDLARCTDIYRLQKLLNDRVAELTVLMVEVTDNVVELEDAIENPDFDDYDPQLLEDFLCPYWCPNPDIAFERSCRALGIEDYCKNKGFMCLVVK